MDLEIREFSQAIVNFINRSNLPTEVKRLCIKDICTQLDGAATQVIQAQAAERDKAQKETEKAAEVEQAATEAGESSE